MTETIHRDEYSLKVIRMIDTRLRVRNGYSSTEYTYEVGNPGNSPTVIGTYKTAQVLRDGQYFSNGNPPGRFYHIQNGTRKSSTIKSRRTDK